jgi:hypothetical protein
MRDNDSPATRSEETVLRRARMFARVRDRMEFAWGLHTSVFGLGPDADPGSTKGGDDGRKPDRWIYN